VNSVFGNLGPVGLALVLTIVLIIGHSGGGKVKPLGWWPTLFLALLAGSAYRAAGGIFKIVPDFVGSLIGTAKGIIPGVTMPALALSLLAFLLFKKLTTKQVGVTGHRVLLRGDFGGRHLVVRFGRHRERTDGEPVVSYFNLRKRERRARTDR
jgi:hypothetical protein